MAKKVTLVMTEHEAGEVSVALQSWQMDVEDQPLRAYRIGLLLDKLNQARWAVDSTDTPVRG